MMVVVALAAVFVAVVAGLAALNSRHPWSRLLRAGGPGRRPAHPRVR